MTQEITKPLDTLEKQIDKLIENAPDAPQIAPDRAKPVFLLPKRSGFPDAFRSDFERPSEIGWQQLFENLKRTTRQGEIIILIGKPGSGKTTMAAEIAKDTYKGESRYYTFAELFMKLQSTFKGNSKQAEYHVFQALAEIPLLILDELQDRGYSNWEDVKFTDMLKRRQGNHRPTIIMGNVSLEGLSGELDASIMSRARASGFIANLGDTDYRMMQKGGRI